MIDTIPLLANLMLLFFALLGFIATAAILIIHFSRKEEEKDQTLY